MGLASKNSKHEIIFYFMLPKKYQKYLIGSAALVLITIFSLFFSWWRVCPSGPSSKNSPKITFYDVGQGDSIFIQTAEGSQILIDGGPDDSIVNLLSRDLPFYDRYLDLVILTHPHLDHLAGLIEVLQRYQVGLVISNPFSYSSQAYRQWLSLISGDQVVHAVYAGDKFCLDEVCFIALWPDPSVGGSLSAEAEARMGIDSFDPCAVLDEGDCLIWTDENTNNGSLVLLAAYSNKKLLLTGDAETEVWDKLLAENKLEDIDFLKVPHHGSSNGVTLAALEVLKPEFSVISVGKDNRYGLPSPQVLGWSNLYGTVWQTSDQGSLYADF